MSRENILFGVVGLLLGYVIAFHLVVHINQTRPGGGSDSLPEGHPALAGGVGASGVDAQRLKSAADAAARAADDAPKDFDAQVRAAEAYIQASGFDDAAGFLVRANTLRPDDYNTLVRLGTVYSAASRFDEAERWYKAALDKNPNDLDARSELALTYFMRTPPQGDRAVAELRRNLEADPRHLPSLHNLTLMLLEIKRYDEAEATLDKIAKIKPDYEQLPRLRAEVEKARRAAPSNAEAGKGAKKSPTD
jgi:tetratricopeptide (TPR) repeat protein